MFVQHPAAEAVDVNEIEVDYEPEQASQGAVVFSMCLLFDTRTWKGTQGDG